MKDAKGHGSNKRGEHSALIEKIGNFALHPGTLAAIRKKPNGFTVKPGTGFQPTTGFAVARAGSTVKLRADDLRGPQGAAIIANYARAHAAEIEAGAHIGGWTDKRTGITHLDIVDKYKSPTEAKRAGRVQNQIAIFDLKRKRTINTGGTGD